MNKFTFFKKKKFMIKSLFISALLMIWSCTNPTTPGAALSASAIISSSSTPSDYTNHILGLWTLNITITNTGKIPILILNVYDIIYSSDGSSSTRDDDFTLLPTHPIPSGETFEVYNQGTTEYGMASSYDTYITISDTSSNETKRYEIRGYFKN
jgi:hypothetical protein